MYQHQHSNILNIVTTSDHVYHVINMVYSVELSPTYTEQNKMQHVFMKICLFKLWGITYTHPSGKFVPKLLLCMIIRMYYYVEYMCLATISHLLRWSHLDPYLMNHVKVILQL